MKYQNSFSITVCIRSFNLPIFVVRLLVVHSVWLRMPPQPIFLNEVTDICPAPIFHLYTTDRYRPSSLNAFLGHTRPKIDFKDTAIPSPPLTLANLDQLNSLAAERRGEIYLTSSDDVTKNPDWLDGVKVSSDNGTGNERTGVIIIVDKGMGVVDVFYFVFWAFNWGGIVLEKQLGLFFSAQIH